ncbi:MAG: DUF2461 domain-containing protein [Bacteroidales bacterium]|jgi:uncharacterized protein (TIGR02453 family)|nr:DUF2461 domain-containing protein [Bacteroidales bacterium]
MMKFFTLEFIDFFTGLEKNNSKEWFDINRKVYESEVKKPFNDFVTNLILAISQFDNSIEKDTKKALFRINRDIRFSKDKTPYKTNVSAAIVKGGRKSPYPGYYIGIGAEKVHIGGGLYKIEKDDLSSIRNHILDNQKEFLNIIDKKEFKSTFGEVMGEKNKKLTPEFNEILDKLPLIANKQFYFMTEVESKGLILEEDLIDRIAKMYEIGFSLNNFLAQALV